MGATSDVRDAQNIRQTFCRTVAASGACYILYHGGIISSPTPARVLAAAAAAYGTISLTSKIYKSSKSKITAAYQWCEEHPKTTKIIFAFAAMGLGAFIYSKCIKTPPPPVLPPMQGCAEKPPLPITQHPSLLPPTTSAPITQIKNNPNKKTIPNNPNKKTIPKAGPNQSARKNNRRN